MEDYIIEAIFGQNVADFIKANPLSRIDADDVLMCSLEHNGIYSVKSGYKFLVRTDNNAPNLLNGLNEDDKSRVSQLWKKIWLSKVPIKIHN